MRPPQRAALAGGTGRVGGHAVAFTKSTSAAFSAASTALDALSLFTLEAWIYAPVIVGNTQIIVRYRNTVGWQLALSSTNDVQLLVQSTTGSAQATFTATIVPVGVWTHVAGTWDGAHLLCFLNGVRSPSTTLGGVGGVAGSVPVSIGNSTTPTSPFVGCIQELRVSNTLRYAGATNQLPTAPFFLDSATLALWHMSEGQGTTCFDSGPSGLHMGFAGKPYPRWVPGCF